MRIARTVLLLVAATTVAACSDSTGPRVQDVAGNYTAGGITVASRRGSLTTTDPINGTVDWLAEGATIDLVLNAAGTTSGHIYLPDTGDGVVDADLAGTWTLDGSTVHLTQSADTFLRDIPLTVKGSTLVGDQTFSGVRVQVTLQRVSMLD